LALALGVTLTSGVAVMAAPQATGKTSSTPPRTARCGNFTGYGGGGVTDRFTRVRATRTSCHTADVVLGIWSNSAPGGKDDGFACRARKTKTSHVFHLRCTDGHKRVTATDHQKL
jgi:hypothetical protein